MTRRRWIADEVSGNRAILYGQHADHLSRVLRARVGQEFDVVANGGLRRGTVIDIADGRVEFELAAGPAATPTETLSQPHNPVSATEQFSQTATPGITLLISIFKFDRMEWSIEKSTELGARSIVPVIAQRTDIHLAKASEKRMERWRRLAVQASEQSRRLFPPEIHPPIRLKEAVTLNGTVRLFLNEAEKDVTLLDALQHSELLPDVTLAFGPEGGWTEGEVALFQSTGWSSVSLGPTVLRAETAVIAATAIVMSASWKVFRPLE